jgi:hypothetical protein
MKSLFIFETTLGCVWIVSATKKEAWNLFKKEYPGTICYSQVLLGKVLV